MNATAAKKPEKYASLRVRVGTHVRVADGAGRLSIDDFLESLMSLYDSLPKSVRNCIIAGDIEEAIALMRSQKPGSSADARTDSLSA